MFKANDLARVSVKVEKLDSNAHSVQLGHPSQNKVDYTTEARTISGQLPLSKEAQPQPMNFLKHNFDLGDVRMSYSGVRSVQQNDFGVYGGGVYQSQQFANSESKSKLARSNFVFGTDVEPLQSSN